MGLFDSWAFLLIRQLLPLDGIFLPMASRGFQGFDSSFLCSLLTPWSLRMTFVLLSITEPFFDVLFEDLLLKFTEVCCRRPASCFFFLPPTSLFSYKEGNHLYINFSLPSFSLSQQRPLQISCLDSVRFPRSFKVPESRVVPFLFLC